MFKFTVVNCVRTPELLIQAAVPVWCRAGKWLRKKPTFKKKSKNHKSPKFRFFYFLVKFYTNHILNFMF